MGYRPGPKRRSYIPKPGSAKGRPLGISNFEDKIVELATKRTLEPIYEAVFEDSSHGYRPGRNQHQCLEALGRTIQQKKVNHVVEADIKSFFDKVNHEWMIKFLRHRIGDERVIRLIIRMLKSGIMEDGLVKASEQGTPQGSILSPLLSNIYLHYVLDLWFSRRVRRLFNDVCKTAWKGLVLNWPRRKRAASNLAVLHAKMRTSVARSPRSLPFWGLRTIAARPRGDTSRLNVVPVRRNWARVCASSQIGQRKPDVC
jgi:group II intron reverse transcriptase/maturase